MDSKTETMDSRELKMTPAGRLLPTHAAAAGLTTVSEAVRTFLVSEFQAREVRVTKIAALPGSEAGWEAEAEILVPDLAIMTLGLTLTQEVLELRTHAVQLDQSLTIRSYEPLDHGG